MTKHKKNPKNQDQKTNHRQNKILQNTTRILSLIYDIGFLSLHKQTSVLALSNCVLKEVLKFDNHQDKNYRKIRTCVYEK